MVMFAEDDEMMRRALETLDEWCTERAVRVNVDKCEIMHVRKKGVKRSQQEFVVNGEAVQNVVEYLGCTIDDYAECRVMVNYRAKAGAWLGWCEGGRTGKSVNDMSMI